ncbi:MAG: DUF6377 domain-containing protein [Saprospiraceae bacterium]
MGYANLDSLLNKLDQNILLRPVRLHEKYEHITTLRHELANSRSRSDSFQIILNLSREYQSFNYDTAYIEIQRLKNTASSTNEKNQAEIQDAFILLSSGLFRESIDKLNGLSMEQAPDSIKRMYFFYLARSYFDMVDAYTHYLNIEKQFRSGLDYLDLAIHFAEENSVEQLSYKGLKALKINEREESKKIYLKLIHFPAITTRQLAIEYSVLSSLYEGTDQDSVLFYMINAAIADEKALVMESTALTYLSKYFANSNNFERASRYIDLALADANYFGAQYRKMQILDILPLIEKRRLDIEKSKFRQFVIFSGILTGLLLFSVFLIYRTQRQKKYINEQNLQIHAQNEKLMESEATIRDAYRKLEVYAKKLNESSKLKEKYIGHFFEGNSNLINRINSLFTSSLKLVHEGKFKDAIYTLKQFNDTYEMKKLLQDFDSTFLTVFPNFIEQINQFFPKTEQFPYPGKDKLTLELRIFALIRLGISNNHTIAKIHDYSVNTIYTYKTKIRNKSSLSSDEFDMAILEIKSIWDKEVS